VSAFLGCSAVFVNQAAENLPTLDPGRDIHGAARPPRRFLLQALMRSMAVVVAAEFGQDLAQMPFAEDQDTIQALASERSHKPLSTESRTRGCPMPGQPGIAATSAKPAVAPGRARH